MKGCEGGSRAHDPRVRLVTRVRSIIPIVLVTNATTRLETALELLGLGAAFDFVVNSARVGAAKPDRRIFEFAVGLVGATMSECLFVDDSLGHVDAARALGFRVHHYTSVAGLERMLTENDLLEASG